MPDTNGAAGGTRLTDLGLTAGAEGCALRSEEANGLACLNSAVVVQAVVELEGSAFQLDPARVKDLCLAGAIDHRQAQREDLIRGSIAVDGPLKLLEVRAGHLRGSCRGRVIEPRRGRGVSRWGARVPEESANSKQHEGDQHADLDAAVHGGWSACRAQQVDLVGQRDNPTGCTDHRLVNHQTRGCHEHSGTGGHEMPMRRDQLSRMLDFCHGWRECFLNDGHLSRVDRLPRAEPEPAQLAARFPQEIEIANCKENGPDRRW